jgi:hypothetical protein
LLIPAWKRWRARASARAAAEAVLVGTHRSDTITAVRKYMPIEQLLAQLHGATEPGVTGWAI